MAKYKVVGLDGIVREPTPDQLRLLEEAQMAHESNPPIGVVCVPVTKIPKTGCRWIDCRRERDVE